MTAASDEALVLAAVRTGDEATFGALAERYRHQLRVHIYRMLGSFEEAEDLVQETLLRAWRGRAGFEGRSLFRTWLYRIATNLCLNALERAPRRILPADIAPPAAFDPNAAVPSEPPWAPELPWLQPYPDALLEPVAPRESEPDAVVVTRETIELAYLTAIQHLPPRQRAILLLRDALDWSAAETAELLETTVASVTSALQRARSTMRTLQPAASADRQPSSSQSTTAESGPTDQERGVLRRFMEAWEQADTNLLIQLLREDARMAMPPAPLWFDGRASIAKLFELFPIDWQGEFRMVATSANRQPAAAAYLRKHGETTFGLAALLVLRIETGAIVEIMTFAPELVHGFDLPAVLTDEFRALWGPSIRTLQTEEHVMQSNSVRAEMHTGTVRSTDGTPIAYERRGEGPPLILVVGAFNERSTGAPLAQYLAPHHTVFTYDRRGRGESGDSAQYAIERELEDLSALIAEAGGSAAVFGFSSGALLAAKAAARGLAVPKLVLYEPPYLMIDPRADHAGKIASLVSAGKRGEAVEYFQTQLVGIPPDIVVQLRNAPFRPGLEAMAHTLVYETLICTDTELEAELGSIGAPTLVLAGETSPPPLQAAARALANEVPNAHYQSVAGVGHDLVPEVLGPVVGAHLR